MEKETRNIIPSSTPFIWHCSIRARIYICVCVCIYIKRGGEGDEEYNSVVDYDYLAL